MNEIIYKTEYPSDGVIAKLVIDRFEGKLLDTHIELSGGFCLSYENKSKFMDAFRELIEEYRI